MLVHSASRFKCTDLLLINSSKLRHILWHSALYGKFHYMTAFRDSARIFRIADIIGYIEVFCNFSNICCCLITFERQLMRDHWRSSSQQVLSVWDCLQFSALIGRTRDSLHIRWVVGGACSQRLRDRLTLTECWAQTGCIEPNSAFKH